MKWALVTIIVLATTAGEVLQAIGMRRHGEIHDFRPGALGRVVSTLAQSRYILAAIFAMAVSFFAFMALVSMSELALHGSIAALGALILLHCSLFAVLISEIRHECSCPKKRGNLTGLQRKRTPKYFRRERDYSDWRQLKSQFEGN